MNKSLIITAFGALLAFPLMAHADQVRLNPPVEFKSRPEATSTKERIDRLVWGVMLEIPAEYDYYGYEIKRRMDGALATEVLTDKETRMREYAAILEAKELLKKWEDDLWAQMFEIDQRLQNRPDKEQRARLEQYQITLGQFFARANDWVNANARMLQFLITYEDDYRYDVPNFRGRTPAIEQKFTQEMHQRDQYRARMTIYPPFKNIPF